MENEPSRAAAIFGLFANKMETKINSNFVWHTWRMRVISLAAAHEGEYIQGISR